MFFCKNQTELLIFLERINEQKISSSILLEEFIIGPVFSVETISYKGQHRILGLSDRTIGPLPYFVELGATFPINVDLLTFQRVTTVINELFKVLNVNQGMIHTELILSDQGPVIVEVNPRLGGGYIGPMISESYDIDIYEQIINLALDKEPQIPISPVKAASFYILFPHKSGSITKLSGESSKKYPGVKEINIRKKIGDKVTYPVIDYKGDIAIIFTSGTTPELAVSNCKAATSAIEYQIT